MSQHKTMAEGNIVILRVDLPAAPDLGYPEPGSVWFTSLDGEAFYPADGDTSVAPPEEVKRFWARCHDGVPMPEEGEGLVRCAIGADRAYIRASAARNGWTLTELTR